MSDEDTALNELLGLRFWLEHHLKYSVEARTTSGYGPKRESYAVVAIPEWDVRQKLAQINAMFPKAAQ